VKAEITEGREPRPSAVIGDHEAEDRTTFERHAGLTVTGTSLASDRDSDNEVVINRSGYNRFGSRRSAPRSASTIGRW
jgi:hypothetical protein